MNISSTFLPRKKITALLVFIFGLLVLQPYLAHAASPVFRSQASAVVNSTTLTVNKPAGTTDGDIMVAEILQVSGSSAVPSAPTTPSGWVLRQTGTEASGTNNYRFSVYTKVASGEGASYTWTSDSTAWNMAGGIASYSGGDTANPVDVSSVNPSTTASTNRVATSITTTVSDTTIVGAYTQGYWDATWTPPAGMTERIDTLIGGDWGSVMLSDVPQASAGASGDKIATASVSHSGTGILLALRGTSGGTPPPPTGDTTAPTTPAGLSATVVSTSQINLNWTASADNVGVTGYNIYRGGTQIASVANTSYNDTGLTANTSYTYYIQAIDAAGNVSPQSTSVSATTQSTTPPPTDTTAPSVPTSLSASAVSSSQINLSWTASTDNVGVTGYTIYRNGTQLTTTTGTSYSDTGLASGTLYTYTVAAYDLAGNASAQSTSASATTQAATAPPPSSGTNAPVVFFSDLDSGPNTGGENNNGVYVTIKGINFGSTRGTSYVSVGGGQVASYQLWTDSKIIFQLGPNTSTGSITVTTGNGTSNGVPFTVRAGTIYFVSVTGTGNGLSVTTPMSPSAAYTVMGPGKTFYFRAGTYNQNYSGGGLYGYRNYSLDQAHGGTAGQPMAMVGYPNETATFQYLDISRSNIGMNNGGSPASYVTFANFTLVGGSAVFEDGGFYTNPNSGGVGIRLINNVMSAAYGGANTMTGVILVQNNYWKILGNELKNTGTGAPINNNHGIYNQAGSSYTEIAWNYFHDLRMGGVVQVHTDPYYSYYGVSIHDNVFAKGANGDSRAIVLGNQNGDTYGYIFNNIFDSIGSGYGAIGVWSGNWKIYNNTMYNIQAAGSNMVWITNAAYTSFGAPSSWLPGPNVDIKNNIFYSDGSTPYFSSDTSHVTLSMDHNLYYNNGAAPSQDTSPITGNPLFVSATTNGDFHLQSTSPAKDVGTSAVSTVVAKDHDGLSRPQGLAYDIGAYEYASGGTTLPPPGDTTPPSVSISAPATGTTISGTVTVSANASDNVGVVGVQFKLDGVNLGAEDTSSPYSVSWNTTAATNGTHTLTATARDLAGNMTTSSSVIVTVSNITPDTTPPTTPTGLTATAVSSSQINLAWNASTDPMVAGQTNSGVSGYRIYRNGVQIGTSPTPSFSNTGLAAATTYSYTVAAVDAANNVSAQSGSASATTQSVTVPDTTAPTVSLTAPAGGTTVLGTITVSATASDNVGVTGVQFKLDNGNLSTEDTTAPYSVSWNTTGATNGTHTLLAVARDAAGNRATSTVATVTVNNVTPDTTNPIVTITTPMSVATYATTASSVSLGGTASDNVGVTSVSWSNAAGGSGTALGTTAWTTTIALQSGANAITVTARDQAGNTSTDTLTVTYTPTTPPDTTAPSIPTGLTANVISSSEIDLSWTASTDNTAVTGYKVYANGTQVATTTTTSYNHTNLSPFTTYVYAVSAYDAANNISTLAASITATTQAQQTAPPPSTGGGSTGGGGGGTTSSSSGGSSSSGSTSSGTTGSSSASSGGIASSGGVTGSSSTGGSATSGETSGSTTTLPPVQGPFSIGMNSNDVKNLQELLRKDGVFTGDSTGYYGPLTQKAVQDFQVKYNLVISGSPSTTGFGLAGPGTRAKLNTLYAGTSSGGSSSTLTDPQKQALINSLKQQIATLVQMVADLTARLQVILKQRGAVQ